MLGGLTRSCCQEGASQGGGALVAAAGRRVESGRSGGRQRHSGVAETEQH